MLCQCKTPHSTTTSIVQISLRPEALLEALQEQANRKEALVALAMFGREEDSLAVLVVAAANAKAMAYHGALHKDVHCVDKPVASRKDSDTVVLVVDSKEDRVECSIRSWRWAS